MKRFLVSNEVLREKYPSYSCLPFCYPTSRHRHPQVSQVDTHGHSLLSQLGKCCPYRAAMSFIYLNAAHKKEAKAEPIGEGVDLSPAVPRCIFFSRKDAPTELQVRLVLSAHRGHPTSVICIFQGTTPRTTHKILKHV